MSVFRVLRTVWPLLFLLPGGVFAGRFCWLDAVDPLYHAWLRLHENAPVTVAFLGLACAGVATWRFVRLQWRVRSLVALGRKAPERVVRAFLDAGVTNGRVVFIEANQRFCFTIFHGPTVVISSAFADAIDDEQLGIVAHHESQHVKRRDPWRAFAWHLGYAALIVPLFEDVERMQHALREHAVDANSGFVSFESGHRVKNTARVWGPLAATAVIFTLVLLSHAVFMRNLTYLQIHHC